MGLRHREDKSITTVHLSLQAGGVGDEGARELDGRLAQVREQGHHLRGVQTLADPHSDTTAADEGPTCCGCRISSLSGCNTPASSPRL
jgi:hypothetical protein